MHKQNHPPDKEKNKGGRPMKTYPRNIVIRMACSKMEEGIIEEKVKMLNTTKSEFLRELALNGKIVSRRKALPAEVLSFNGPLNHIAANLNQLTKKHNQEFPFTAMEIAEINFLIKEIFSLTQSIKTYINS